MGKPKPTKVEMCLFICFIFGNSIPIDDLVIYAMGLKTFKDVCNMIQGRHIIQEIINDLITRRLIKLCGHANQYVEMLGDGRKLATMIASKYKLAIVHRRYCRDEYQGKPCYGLLSFLQCENQVSILQAQCRQGTHGLPTNFFYAMDELRILSLVIPSLTPQIFGLKLKYLRTLRLKVLHLKDLSWVGDLKYLKFLCVSTPSLIFIPKELGKLGNLRFLDLRETELVCIPPGVLSRMVKLEELYLPMSFRRWGCMVNEEEEEEEEEEGNGRKNTNASLSEIASLKLSALHISALNASIFPKKSPIFKRIQRFKILLDNDFEYQPNMEGPMNMMQLTDDTRYIKESGINGLMWRAEDLRLTRVRNLKDIMGQLEVDDFPHLKKMLVSECNELECLVATTENSVRHSSFGELECLHLSKLPNLKEIWHGAQPHFGWFENLRQINIRFCHELKYVFPMSMASGMRQLKSIEILDCYEMEGVFNKNEGAYNSNEICFAEEIHLYSLPKFIGFLVEKNDTIDQVQNDTGMPFTTNEEINSHMEMNSAFSSDLMENGLEGLKVLKIAFCDELKIIFSFDENPATSEVLSSLERLELHGLRNFVHLISQIPRQVAIFLNLQLLVLSECHNLYVLSPSVAKLLVQLQKIQISRCPKMEEIVVKEYGKEVEPIADEIVFPQLRDLELQYMPNLRIFHGGISAIKMPSLSFLKLNECSKMECFSNGSLHTPMLERVQINGSLYSLTEDLNATMKGCNLFPYTF